VKLVVIRHGEYVFDIERIKAGDFNPELSQKGKEQVRNLSKEMKSRFGGGNIAIYSSPARRARESAAIIRQVLGVPRVIIRKRLRDVNLGLTGPERAEFISQAKRAMKEWIGGRLEKAETHESFLERIRREMDYLKKTAEKRNLSAVIVVAHEETVWGLISILRGRTLPEASETKVDFAGLWEFQL